MKRVILEARVASLPSPSTRQVEGVTIDGDGHWFELFKMKNTDSIAQASAVAVKITIQTSFRMLGKLGTGASSQEHRTGLLTGLVSRLHDHPSSFRSQSLNSRLKFDYDQNRHCLLKLRSIHLHQSCPHMPKETLQFSSNYGAPWPVCPVDLGM